jgi:hypothetical protein
MEYIQRHLNQDDIQGAQTYRSTNPFFEYVTCVRANPKSEWTCIPGAYERFCEEDPAYSYKIHHVHKFPTFTLKKFMFESQFKNHTLFPKMPKD